MPWGLQDIDPRGHCKLLVEGDLLNAKERVNFLGRSPMKACINTPKNAEG
jgi:hypothetical protein